MDYNCMDIDADYSGQAPTWDTPESLYPLPFSSEQSSYPRPNLEGSAFAAPWPVSSAADNHSSGPINPSIYNLRQAESIFSFGPSWGTPATSVCEEDFVSQISQDIQDKVDSLERDELHRLRNVLQRGLTVVDSLLLRTTPTEATDRQRYASRNVEYRCVFCRSNHTYRSRGTLKRHAITEHFSDVTYVCPVQGCSMETRRRDKFNEHQRRMHPSLQLNLQEATIRHQVPSSCPVCEHTITSWDELWKCFVDHSEIPLNNSPLRSLSTHVRQPTSYSYAPRAQITPTPISQRAQHEQPGNAEPESRALLSDGSEKSLEPGAGITDYKVLAPSNPCPMEQDMHTPKNKIGPLSPNSSSPKSLSADTGITTPEAAEDQSIDSLVLRADCLDFILNPAAHNEALCALEAETARLCGLYRSNIWPDVQSGLSIRTIPIEECVELLKGCQAAFCHLRDEGFCGRLLTLFIEPPFGADTAKAVHITLEDIETLVMRLSANKERKLDPSSLEIANKLTKKLRPLSSLLLDNSDPSPYLSFLYRALSLSIVSFAGSHASAFDVISWNLEKNIIPVGLGYSFARRRLACLSKFVGGPVWTLGKDSRTQDDLGLALSMNLQDLQQLWGPVWMVGGTEEAAPIIRTERGYITPRLASNPTNYTSGDVVCHWSKDLPEPYLPGQLAQSHILIHKSSRLLVGANDGAKSLELIVNKECKADVNMIQQQVVSELKFPGTCKAYYIGDGYEVSLSGGYQVNAGFVKRWKRMPARTYRSTLLAYCTSPGAEILPILKLDVGLEVSICTGNSRRVSLWDAIQLSQAKQEGVGCEYKQVLCCHPVGSIECISNCWNWAARGEIDRTLDLPGDHEDFNRASARRKLINAILALEHTGINHQGQLQALWPFSGCPQVLHIPSSTKRQKHSWISLVKDTTDSSTFAVLSQRCLELRYPPSNSFALESSHAHLTQQSSSTPSI
ncbi:hypothetical protein ASPCAL11240 [Aspergillus calidoustus]|uniref:C2H2-type domain-containing protein n=1 Tax=Aspergillus calidoustus TaxID=454130 RepID=A0A0U5G9Z6_ASPCI|nr:hypothetical protein ASPCAL11240 [Aspergillus calidoustus]